MAEHGHGHNESHHHEPSGLEKLWKGYVDAGKKALMAAGLFLVGNAVGTAVLVGMGGLVIPGYMTGGVLAAWYLNKKDKGSDKGHDHGHGHSAQHH